MRINLWEARKKAKLTQEKLAEAVGIDRTTYNKIERGKQKEVPVDLAIRISKVLKKSVENLFLNSNVNHIHKTPKAKAG